MTTRMSAPCCRYFVMSRACQRLRCHCDSIAVDEKHVGLVPISVHLFEFPGPPTFSGMRPVCLATTSAALREQMVTKARPLRTSAQIVGRTLKRMFVTICWTLNTLTSVVSMPVSACFASLASSATLAALSMYTVRRGDTRSLRRKST